MIFTQFVNTAREENILTHRGGNAVIVLSTNTPSFRVEILGVAHAIMEDIQTKKQVPWSIGKIAQIIMSSVNAREGSDMVPEIGHIETRTCEYYAQTPCLETQILESIKFVNARNVLMDV